jgi:ELWxxDGT repeat protein
MDEYHELIASGSRLFFEAASLAEGAELWVSDGSDLGTFQLKDLNPGAADSEPNDLTALGAGGVLFGATDEIHGTELFISMGTSATTSLLQDLLPGIQTGNSNPDNLAVFSGGDVYFAATDGVTGREPYHWSALGGLQPLGDLGDNSSFPEQFTQVWLGDHEAVFFRADTPPASSELWVTDGTASGTTRLVDFPIVPSSPNTADQLTASNGQLFFTASDPVAGNEVWVSDGTQAGTHIILDVVPGAGHEATENLVAYGAGVAFVSRNLMDMDELWISDGTAPGTQRLDTAPFIEDLRVVQGQLSFTRGTGSVFHKFKTLWATDGTTLGTRQVASITGVTDPTFTEEFAVIGGTLYFVVFGPGTGAQLWRSDLTTAGTSLVAIMSVGGQPSFALDSLVASGDRLFFTALADDGMGGSLGLELFVSDGTPAGTGLAVDIVPGPLGGDISAMTAAGGGVYFVPGADSGLDQEIWFSDGTPAGTAQVCDITNDPLSFKDSTPTELTLVDGDLFVAASRSFGPGRELYRWSQAGAYVQDLGPLGPGMRIEASLPKLGRTHVVSGYQSPVGLPSALVMSAPLAAPSNLLVNLGSASWIDPSTFSLLGVTATQSWSLSFPLPSSPGLVGANLNLQSWTLGSPVFPADTSNGLRVVLGF